MKTPQKNTSGRAVEWAKCAAKRKTPNFIPAGDDLLHTEPGEKATCLQQEMVPPNSGSTPPYVQKKTH